jgi:hypothetical protein
VCIDLYDMSRSTGAFVYTGSGKKQADDADIAQKKCKKQACAIQWCLARSNHIESRCAAFIQDWKECTERVHAAHNEASGFSAAGAPTR